MKGKTNCLKSNNESIYAYTDFVSSVFRHANIGFLRLLSKFQNLLGIILVNFMKILIIWGENIFANLKEEFIKEYNYVKWSQQQISILSVDVWNYTCKSQ